MIYKEQNIIKNIKAHFGVQAVIIYINISVTSLNVSTHYVLLRRTELSLMLCLHFSIDFYLPTSAK